jgi:hypothetical protein
MGEPTVDLFVGILTPPPCGSTLEQEWTSWGMVKSGDTNSAAARIGDLYTHMVTPQVGLRVP